MKVVIIGGVAGGASAAARLRRLNEDAEIIMIERTGFVSYANCGLPYYAGGKIADRADLTVQTPDGFRSRFNVDVRVRHEVTAIDAAAKTVKVRRLREGTEYTESYDKLILSPGAKPLRPDMPGVDSDRIYLIRTVEDVLHLREAIVDSEAKSAVIAGGGYIGLEMAENLVGAGIKTTIVQRPDQVLKPLDKDMSAFVHNYLIKKGVGLELGASVTGFETTDKITTKLKDGRSFVSDIVIMALGVSPESALAKAAGIKLGVRDSIAVNEYMETSVKDIYAVGDAVQVKNFVTGKDDVISLAGPANKQGRIAADNICGIKSKFTGSQGSSVVKIFDMTVATTGINEKGAEEAGIPCGKVYMHSASHATYYPGAKYMTVKVVFEPESGRILGAQIIGTEGVDKRIDVLATAIRAGMTSDDLEELDLAYAPPFSSAKDPVNMAGYAIGNVRKGLVKQYFWSDIEALPRDGSVILLDVRDPDEYEEGHIKGYINMPLDEIRGRLGELDRNKDVYALCYSGHRSYIACRILSQNGYRCNNLAGGIRLYRIVTGGL